MPHLAFQFKIFRRTVKSAICRGFCLFRFPSVQCIQSMQLSIREGELKNDHPIIVVCDLATRESSFFYLYTEANTVIYLTY